MTALFGPGHRITPELVARDVFAGGFAEGSVPVRIRPRDHEPNCGPDHACPAGYPTPLEAEHIGFVERAIQYWNTAAGAELLRLQPDPHGDFGVTVQLCMDDPLIIDKGVMGIAYATLPNALLDERGSIVCLPRHTNWLDFRAVTHELGHAGLSLLHTREGGHHGLVDANLRTRNTPYDGCEGDATVMASTPDEPPSCHVPDEENPGAVDVLVARLAKDRNRVPGAWLVNPPDPDTVDQPMAGVMLLATGVALLLGSRATLRRLRGRRSSHTGGPTS